MRSFRTHGWLAAGMLVLLLSPGSALALTLDDLNGGAIFDSLDGSLRFTFDPGSVMVRSITSKSRNRKVQL